MSDLATFLEAEVYEGEFRPVQLREYVLLSGQLLEVTGPPSTVRAGGGDVEDWRALLTPRRTPVFQVRMGGEMVRTDGGMVRTVWWGGENEW